MLTPNFPDQIDAARFLAEYWQQRPLLIRNAFADFRCDIEPDDLAGMACEEGVESRLVLERGGEAPWEVRYGPFAEQLFGELPESHWTLLIQDVDKFIPEVARLLDYFRFLPDWRLDDVMVSYAADQGSVGPHVDDYDVFLFQAQGERRWRIHRQPVAEDDYIPGLDLRILPEFEVEEEWLLRPGDCLYLPPNVAHWGVAEGECVTCSVGFRAPPLREMFADWCDELVDTRPPEGRYRDPALAPQVTPGQILPEVIERLQRAFADYLREDPEQMRRWFGRYISATKANLQVEPSECAVTQDEFFRRFREGGVVHRNPMSRMAFSKGAAGHDSLFVNGAEYLLPALQGGILAALTHYRELHLGYLEPWLSPPESRELLYRLYCDGHLEFDDE